MIWKYILTIEGKQTLMMPEAARLLCVQMQDGIPCLWAVVDKDSAKVLAKREPRTVFTVGTGHPMPEECGKYVGTYQPMNGLVFHVFGKRGEDYV
jgi:hypothetical protein